MRKLRVVEFTNHLGFGGTEKTLYRFCKHLDKERFEVSVVAFTADRKAALDDRIKDMGVDVRLTSPQYLSKALERIGADIFHTHRAGWPEPGAITAAKQAGIPIVVEHNVFGRLDQSEENAQIDCHILISYSCAWRYQMWLGRPLVSPRYEVLYYPLDIDQFDQFGFEGRDFHRKAIGRIGRPDDTKWDFEYIQALPLIAAAFPDFEFHVIGLTPSVLAYLRKNGLDRNLIEHPLTSDENELMQFYKDISILTHFSQIGETFGLVLAEAMAARLPVVTHQTAPLTDSAQGELIISGYNGVVAVNPQMYANAVIHMLTHPDEAREAGLHGCAKAKALYYAPAITRGLEEIFLNLATGKGLGTCK
jgi:glycosyltransferase involved in cell wall biosynthesis